ncbi:MAG: DUF559 domain-containing protein, partial [bacterium]
VRFERDHERGNKLTVRGWKIIRITARMIKRDPKRVIETIRDAMRL